MPEPNRDVLVACVGCGGLVPDIDGPVHRYMTASPGCWKNYTELMAGNIPASPLAAMAIDAYAVTHPGVPGPQSTPSVWIHLSTLCFVLERGWPVDRAVRLRAVGADEFAAWPWLEPPSTMGAVTANDVATAGANLGPDAAAAMMETWVEGAWEAWAAHHPAVRDRADHLSRLLD
ncbi:MAG: DUF5946 family protein [Chloroflexota bacterium]